MKITTSSIAQRGITLVFALITLLGLSLAAVALIRAVDTGSSILGNLSFKQDTLLASESGTRLALTWLSANTGNGKLNSDDTANGYLSYQIDKLDPLGRSSDKTRSVIDWNGDKCASYASGSYAQCLTPTAQQDVRNSALQGGQIKAQYLILRLCESTGDAVKNGINCAKPLTSTTVSSNKGSMDYSTQAPPPDPTLAQYFRIIVRAQGTRKSVTYTETLVHF
ncbi:MAG: hypothetical protein RJA44_2345 [Pseudomonadota bacterium]|jgi:Tfp pilus assembly protein PilX